MTFLPTSQFKPASGADWSADLPMSGVEKNLPPASFSVPLSPEPVPTTPAMPVEQLQISETAAEQPLLPAVTPLLSASKEQIRAAVQGDKAVSQATQTLVSDVVSAVVSGTEPTKKSALATAPQAPESHPSQAQLPLGKAASGDVLHLIAPAISPLDTPLPAPPQSDESINVPAPSQEQIVSQTDALVKGTILTVRAIQEKVSAQPDLLPSASQPLLQGLVVSTVVPVLSSGRKNLQDLISGDKTVSEAVGAVASDAMDAVVTGAVSNVGQKLISGAASALGAPPATAEAVGMVAAFTSARLSNVVLEGTGAKIVVMDQTKNWLDRNLTGTPSPLLSGLNQGPLVIEPVLTE
ncbi:MAG: hypothetical protein AB7I41_04500 [Candidatus Sericytochromatia bacterium]